jgi:hypothetical protein
VTSYDVVLALFRRWWILLPSLAVSALVVWTSIQAPAIYWTSYDLNLVAPDRSGQVYSRQDAPAGVIPVAGVLEILLAGNHPGPGAATQQVPIFGLDHRFGFDVRAKDKGLQWSRDYVAALTVQISEPTRAEVLARADELEQQAREALRTVQDDQDVPQDFRLSLDEPQAIQVLEIGPSKIRAAFGGMVLGVAGSIMLTILLDRLLVRRHARRLRVRAA